MKKSIPLLINAFLLIAGLANQHVYADSLPLDTTDTTKRPVYDTEHHIMGSVDRAGTVKDLNNNVVTDDLSKGKNSDYFPYGNHLGNFSSISNIAQELSVLWSLTEEKYHELAFRAGKS
ncbi:hypothetical protein PT277_09095 [Acetobacteraceae bacterium ESL0709]|nr:hypothetical protein [Acetobacteraceae bacterium ESL0697]MDF7678838.1 hypothetical protein [Acetobacteraceae bacterium ESL0709]